MRDSVGWWFGNSSESPIEGPPEYRLVQVTQDTGYTGEPALSPDGRLLAYASDRSGEGNLDIFAHPLGGGDPIPLTTDEADDDSPSFSPDGNRIVFRSSRDGGGIYVVPALGGNARRISDGGFNPRFSPDGANVSFVNREVDTENQNFVRAWIVPVAGGAPRQVETNLAVAFPEQWSPDGRHLLVRGSVAPRDFGRRSEWDWWLVPAEGGDAVALGVQELFAAIGLQLGNPFPRPATWSAEGNWVVFGAQTQGGTRNLWRVRVSPSEKRLVGEPQKLTAGIGEERASVSRDGRIAFMNVSDNWDIWSLPIDVNRAEVKGEPERVVSGLSYEAYPSVSADGRKLVYTSDRSGNDDIWLRDLETERKILR